MTVWASILIAVVTASFTIGLNEGIRYIRDRASKAKLAADWDIIWTEKDTRARVRIAIVENIGPVEAFNVDIALTGDPKFELHPDAPLDKCRPKDAILIMVSDVGTGVFVINWENAAGVKQGPVYRFPNAF